MTRTHPIFLALLAALAAFAPGCALGRTSVNDPISAAALERLVPGQSTAADVVALLGAPTDVVQLGKRSAYRYEHEKTKRAAALLLLVVVFNQDTRQDRVWVFFDENGVLTHVGSTLTADKAEYAMPWSDVHD